MLEVDESSVRSHFKRTELGFFGAEIREETSFRYGKRTEQARLALICCGAA